MLTIFERMCLVRYFELGVVDAIHKKEITCPVYLSTGQESVAATLSTLIGGYLIFTQHRAHDVYLCFGGSPERLRDELLGLPTGTSGGKAGSNCLQWHENGVPMFGHHGLSGENVPLGVGAALGSGKNTVCFFGDGAAEEDYVFAAMGFAVTHKLPVLFVCVDNGLCILTPKEVRRSWSIARVAEALGMRAYDIIDNPFLVLYCARNLTKDLPALINVSVCRDYWHVGAGIDAPPKWNRYQVVKDSLGEDATRIEDKVRKQMEGVWDRELLLKQ